MPYFPNNTAYDPEQYPVANWISNLFSGQEASAEPSPAPTPPVKDPTATANFLDTVTSGQYSPDMMSHQPPQQLADVPGAGTPPPTVSDQVSQAIAAKRQPAAPRMPFGADGYGPGMDAGAYFGAQKAANENTLAANLGQAGQQLAYALARSNQKPDTSAFDAQRAEADQPVKNLSSVRQAVLQDIGAKSTMEENNPQSELAQNIRAAYRPMLAKLGMSDEAIENATPAQMKNYLQQPMEAMTKLKMAQEAKEAQLANTKALRELNMNHQFQTALTGAAGAADKDEVVKGAKKQLSDADRLEQMIHQATLPGGQAIANALPTELALYASQGQRMHQATIEAMGTGSKAFGDRLNQKMTDAKTGLLTPDNARYFLNYVNAARGVAQKQQAQGLKDYADRFSKIHGTDPAQAYDAFGVNMKALQGSGQPGTGLTQSDHDKARAWLADPANANSPYRAQVQQVLNAQGM